jgi:hypothetical protein
MAEPRRLCSLDGCTNRHKGRGLCNKHLLRLRNHGSTDDRRPTFEQRFWAKVDKNGPVPAHRPELGQCWMWTAATNEHGYGVMRPEGKRTGPTIKAHRVSMTLAGQDPKDRCVLHRCDNPPCVNPAHLMLGTMADNTQDMVAKHRGLIGECNGNAKLTEQAVLEIRRRRTSGELRKVLIAEFGVSGATITRIAKGEGWRHVA